MHEGWSGQRLSGRKRWTECGSSQDSAASGTPFSSLPEWSTDRSLFVCLTSRPFLSHFPLVGAALGRPSFQPLGTSSPGHLVELESLAVSSSASPGHLVGLQSLAVSVSKESACNAGDTADMGLIPGLGRSPGERKWQPTPVFLPGKSMDRGARWARVHRVTKSQTQLQKIV